MDTSRKQEISIDHIQYVFAKGVILHPNTYALFLNEIIELSYHNKICPMPITLLQQYSYRIDDKLQNYAQS